ncbi:hypothetical protein RN001_006441 [Aquatica leii]|uniref:DUF4806 domain-containing protein n=1 Tax=Aquatica leii TaxID=1421715 RepID=A0AAN7PDI8_9COLE|nr:hypothetical protein RN001_006441 [Aquatica leii]
MTTTLWRVVKFLSDNSEEESIETVPSSWIRDDEEICYWPPFNNKKDLEKAIKSAWSPNLNWKKYSVKIISKECHQFKVASAKASKALFCSDVDSNTETELPDKRQRKLNKRKMSSTDEEEETDEGSQVKVANYPVPPNLNGTLHGGGSSKSVCVTPSRTYSEKQSQRYCFTALESKMDHFIKLAVMNNRLIKEQQKSLDVIDGKFNQLLNRGTEAGFPIQNQTFGVDDERILEFKKIIPLSTEDDFNKLEEILLSESNEFKDCVVRFLSLGGSNQYKEAVRRIMASVLTDQVSVLYSYRGHKGKKVFQTKELSKLIIRAVQLCEKTGCTILNKDIELEIAIWLSKSKERQNKKH